MAKISSDGEREEADGTSTTLEHVTVEYEDAPDACTMYPRTCSEDDLATHWITAEEGAFVDLTTMR